MESAHTDLLVSSTTNVEYVVKWDMELTTVEKVKGERQDPTMTRRMGRVSHYITRANSPTNYQLVVKLSLYLIQFNLSG